MAELNGRACCLLAICCDGAAVRADALSAMMQKHAGLSAESAESASAFVLQHFGITTLAVGAEIVKIAKLEQPESGMSDALAAMITREYAVHRHQAKIESAH